MPYYVTGSLTFSSQANRNNARTAILAVSAGGAVAWGGGLYPAGVNTSGTTGLTISFVVPDEEARTYARALLNAYSSYARNAGHIATAKAPE